MISLILSGGVGARLWPLSREKQPKQFSPIFSQSLFSQTVQRQLEMGEVMVCTGEPMRALTESALRNDKLQVTNTFYEPVGRNTAPAIGLVCRFLQIQGRTNEVLGVFPSDHFIENRDGFVSALQLAEQCALEGQIVTIGLKPTYPATGFGYIDCKTEVFAEKSGLKAYPVKAFKEKPDEKTAAEYIKKGHYFWNGGMFVFKVNTMIQAFEKYLPEIWQGLASLNDDFSNLSVVYENLGAESIDFGIMEKISNQVNIPCDIGWSDLGSWDDLADATSSGQIPVDHLVIQQSSKGCYSYSYDRKIIAFSNVEDLILVDTPDAILVTKRGQSQSVKNIVDEMRKVTPSITKDHVYEYRPWGNYRNIWQEESFKTKIIEVDAGQQLSYQSHEKRAEIWVTTVGQGEVVLNDDIVPVQPGKVVEIPQGAKHRMRNTGEGPLKFVEVQLGEYFGEDDIKRYQDDYKRV